MKSYLLATAGIAALSLTGMAAHANCSYPSAGNGKHISLPARQFSFVEHEGIVGTWLVDYGPVGQAYIQWHSDGTEWENINHPTFGGNICMGSWKATGPWTVFRNHFGWIFDLSGIISGYFHETETDTLARDGNSYSGTNVTNFYDMDNNLVPAPGQSPPAPAGGYTGTSAGTRIAP